MSRWLVVLCASLYAALSIWGDGPLRTARFADARPPARTVAAAGVTVLPAAQTADPLRKRSAAVRQSSLRQSSVRQSLVRQSSVRPEGPVHTNAAPANVVRNWITARTANVRAQPNKRSALAGKIARDGEVLVLWAEPNGWVRIRTKGHAVSGFVHKSLLTDVPPAPVTVAGTQSYATAE